MSAASTQTGQEHVLGNCAECRVEVAIYTYQYSSCWLYANAFLRNILEKQQQQKEQQQRRDFYKSATFIKNPPGISAFW